MRALGGKNMDYSTLALEICWWNHPVIVLTVLGWAISLILVFVVNPQSFHWSMSMHIPWHMVSTVALVMLISSCATAVVAGRKAVSLDAVRAVKEDW